MSLIGVLWLLLAGGLLVLVVPQQSFAQSMEDRTVPAQSADAGQEEGEVDARLQREIANVLGAIQRFGEVTVDVQAGVVSLAGAVATEHGRTEAEAIAGRFGGVKAVANEIEVSLDIRDQGLAIFGRLQDRLNDLLVSIPLFVVAIAVFLVFLGASRIAARRAGIVNRLTTNPFQRQLMAQTIRVVIIAVGLILALEVLDATSLISAVLGAAGVTGIVLGFALKETIENYVAGLLLSLRQPFSPYDHVHVLDYEGHVIRLTSRATILMTLDGNHVRVPNADVFKSAVVNYSRNPERRFEFDIGIGVDEDLVAARELAIETIGSMPGVLSEPGPDAWVEALGDSNVVMKVLGWIDQREFSLPKVRGEAIRRVKSAFEAADFDLPEPIYRLKVSDGGGASARQKTDAPTAAVTASRSDADTAKIDVSRDTHLEREVAKERADMPDGDLLDPQARRE